MASFEDLTDEQRVNLSRVGFKLFHNPEVSREAKRLLMKADKNVRFPEIENEEVVATQLKERDEKIAALEQRQLEADVAARLREKRAQASDRGLDPDEVEKLIIERGKNGRVIDWESACELLELQQQSAPATPDADNWKPGNQMPGIAEMLKSDDPAKIARNLTHQVIDELRGRHKRA